MQGFVARLLIGVMGEIHERFAKHLARLLDLPVLSFKGLHLLSLLMSRRFRQTQSGSKTLAFQRLYSGHASDLEHLFKTANKPLIRIQLKAESFVY